MDVDPYIPIMLICPQKARGTSLHLLSIHLQVFDYLAQTSAATQTRERISEFLQRSEKYKLTNAEKVQVINLSPSRPVELDGVIVI